MTFQALSLLPRHHKEQLDCLVRDVALLAGSTTQEDAYSVTRHQGSQSPKAQGLCPATMPAGHPFAVTSLGHGEPAAHPEGSLGTQLYPVLLVASASLRLSVAFQVLRGHKLNLVLCLQVMSLENN